MRYVSLVTVLAFAAFLVSGCTEALPTEFEATANAGNGASVSGSGNSFYQSFTFHAREGRNGVSGSANLQSVSSGHFRLDISCFTISGNQATLAGRVTRSGDFDIDGFAAYFTVVDDGEGSSATDQISQVFYDGTGMEDPQVYCDDPPAAPLYDVTQGNVQVRP